jgi:hypothetical protein
MSRLRHALVPFLKAALVFTLTLAIPALTGFGVWRYLGEKDRREAFARTSDPPGVNLPLVTHARWYLPTIQEFQVPSVDMLLNPMLFLIEKENCILAARIDQLKRLGVVPPLWSMRHFISNVGTNLIYGPWQLNRWSGRFDGEVAEAIDRRLHPGSKRRFRWVDIATTNELLYLARRGQHVLLSITCWLEPKGRWKKPRRYLGVNISHAVTITGLKRWVPGQGVFQYAVNDPLPAGPLTHYPVYTEVCTNGYNLVGRQATPFIVPAGPHFRSGYLVEVSP